MPVQPVVYTIEELAQLFKVSARHAYGLVKKGEFPHVKLGSRILIPKEAVDSLLANAEWGFGERDVVTGAGG